MVRERFGGGRRGRPRNCSARGAWLGSAAARSTRALERMKPIPRRNVFLIEFVVIVLPYAFVVGFGVFAIILPSLSFGLADLVTSALIASIAVVPFACGFRLSIAYLTGGISRLTSLPRVWWWGAYFGVVFPLIGLVALLLYLILGDFPVEHTAANPADQPFGPTRISEVAFAIAAAPLLLPLWHLSVERYNFMRSNNALERSVKGSAVGAAGASDDFAPAAPGRAAPRPAQRGR